MGSEKGVWQATEQELIETLTDYFREKGRVLSRREYCRQTDRPFPYGRIENNFGWGRLKRIVEARILLKLESFDEPKSLEFEKSQLVDPKMLTGDDEDRLAIMAGLKAVNLPLGYRRILATMVSEIERALLQLPRYKVPDKMSDKETAVLVLSDLHSGRRNYNDQGVVTYNMDIMVARVGLVKDYVFDILEDRIKLDKLDEFCIAMVGDIVDGSGIFPGQELSQDLTCFVPQICLVTACIWDIIVEVRQRFNIPVKVRGVRGNHGRQYKYCVANNNFDNLVFHLLYMMAYTYDPQGVNVEYSAGAPYLNFSLKDIKCHIRHEAPVQTETPAARAKFLGWKQIHEYSVMLYGHKHHPGGGTVLDADVFMNGCLMAIDDLAENLALFSRPSQRLIGLRPGIGVTYAYNLYADQFGDGDEAVNLINKYPILKTFNLL